VLDINLGRGRLKAFFHKRTRTLLVTDAVLAVPEDPPAVVQLDPYPLLFHARDDALDVVESNMSCHRMAAHLAVCLYFRPSALEMVNLEQRSAMPLKRRIAHRRYFSFFRSDGKIPGSSHSMP